MPQCAVFSHTVLTLLQQCCVSSAVPPAVYCQALHCLSSWIQFGVPLTELDTLTDHIFEAIHNESSFEVALDTLINVFSHPEGNRLVFMCTCIYICVYVCVYVCASVDVWMCVHVGVCEVTKTKYLLLVLIRYPRTMQKLLIQVLQLQSLLQKSIDDKDMVRQAVF